MKDDMETLARLVEGQLNDEELGALIKALRSDPEVLGQARRLVALHGQMGVVLEGDLSSERRVDSVLKAIRDSDGDKFTSGVKRRLLVGRAGRRALAIAALLMLVGVGVWMTGFRVSRVEPMATVQRSENIDWGVVEGPGVGSDLSKGSVISFRSGLVELDLSGRGRMVVEGPAHLEFPEAGLAVLKRGRIVMRATKKGHGYRVETPRGSVIDLGTEFGVSVGADGLVETHVLEGSVEAVGGDGERMTLVQDDGLRFGETGSERIEMDGGQFYTQMPPRRTESLGFIHWSFDEGAGLFSVPTSGGMDAGGSDMVFHAMDRGRAPRWEEGMFGTALGFDGRGAFAESGFPGIGGDKPRTVCFWVKVPDDFSTRQGFGIVSWGQYSENRPGEVWQISVNPLVKSGPIGRLRVGLHAGQVVGETDLRDGQWHHVAVVLYGGSQPNVGTHVMLYLDGEPEPVSRRALREVRTKVEEADHGVWLGRNVTYIRSAPRHQHGGFFRGAVDELFIFDSALSLDEVREVMESNRVTE